MLSAVILPKDALIDGVNDSKKLSEKKREKLYDDIVENAVAWGVGIVEHTVIDEINILNATRRAMKLAIENLSVKPDFILIDAEKKVDTNGIPYLPIIKGDALSISIGAAVAAIGNPELSLGSGILLRLVLFVVMLTMGILFVIRYANKVKANPEKSLIAGQENHLFKTENVGLAEFTPRRIWSLVVFGLVILFCVMGYIPWDSITTSSGTAFDVVNAPQYASQGHFIGNLLGMNKFTEFGWWYFIEFSVIWLIGAIVIGLINKMPEKEFVSVFAQGAADLVTVVFVLAASRGISLFMGTSESGMSITFIYWIQKVLSGVPLWAFVVAGVFAYFAIGLFLQSTSGVAGITMPIFGAVAFALFAASSVGSVGGQTILLSTFTCGINFVCALYPESTNMGICEMAGVPFNVFFKQWLKTLLPILIVAIIIISAAPYIGLV